MMLRRRLFFSAALMELGATVCSARPTAALRHVVFWSRARLRTRRSSNRPVADKQLPISQFLPRQGGFVARRSDAGVSRRSHAR